MTWLGGLIVMSLVWAQNAGSDETLVIADFNSAQKPNNLGYDWGSWDYDPEDAEQGSWDALEPDDYQQPQKGYCVKIDYDVQSPKPAFNGFWMKLGDLDGSSYEWLSFYVRGAADGRFTKRFKVELKNKAGERAVYLVNQVTSAWQEIRIPFRKNPSIAEWRHLTELVIVFDDLLATYKEGALYFDQFQFEK